MQDIEDFPSEANSQKDVIPDRKKNTESKAAHVVITQPSEDSVKISTDIWSTNLTQPLSRPNKLYSNLLM